MSSPDSNYSDTMSRTREDAEIILALVMAKTGKNSEIDTVRMLELMVVFEDRREYVKAGIADELATRSVSINGKLLA